MLPLARSVEVGRGDREFGFNERSRYRDMARSCLKSMVPGLGMASPGFSLSSLDTIGTYTRTREGSLGRRATLVDTTSSTDNRST